MKRPILSEKKICKKCKLEKNLNDFQFLSCKNRYGSRCQCCINEYDRARYKKIPTNKKQRYLEKKTVYRNKNKENDKIWRKQNKEKLLLSMKLWRIKNKEKIRETQKIWFRNKYATDSKFKLSMNLRKRMSRALNKKKKFFNSKILLGCEIDSARRHLESQFKPGMTWDNHGLYGWHIDHIKPCASFDLSNPDEQKVCFHYTNLQPLWAKDNLSKGDRTLEVRI